ncbi:Snf7-domain-containing protein [Pavlovales sp. CCMP2436]|nr:Snf7-domain-containing protein [Pavlovales sp. CCMP2436]|mmetsp:Transcript_15424/g.39116  ORF Transcript_15424/g.39116 Transcript_15424/m.39116 type:complete len:220 (+) Transcript_15424:54-713(+)
MGTLFSRAKEIPIGDNDRALLTLKVTKLRLAKHRAGIRRASEREHAAAEQHAAGGDMLRARDALRRFRYWEQVMDQTDVMLQQLDSLLAGIELAQLNKVVYEGLAAGTAAIKAMQSNLSLEKVERLMDERADVIAVMDEADALLGSTADPELERQLEQLEAVQVLPPPARAAETEDANTLALRLRMLPSAPRTEVSSPSANTSIAATPRLEAPGMLPAS